MSQNIRAVPGDSERHGRIWKVPGSGRASMSDSATRAKPSIAEPSKPMPSAKAPSSSAGATATDLRKPSTSVNQSRTKRISRSSKVRSTNSCCLSTSLPSRPTRAVSASAVSPTLPSRRRVLRLVIATDRRQPDRPPRRRSGGPPGSVERAAGLPLGPGDAPLVVAGSLRQLAAGVADVDDVAEGEGVVEPPRVRRGDVDAPVRDVAPALVGHRPRRGVDELAVGRDAHRERDVLLVVV